MPHSHQGAHPALHQLWRLLPAGALGRDGNVAGSDPPAHFHGEPGMRPAVSHLVALAAGGTGGHMFPAEALARELLDRGLSVALVTDRRTRVV